MMDERISRPPLVVHVIHALSVGGLENGLVNLVNHSPRGHYRHAVVCMTLFDDFRQRIARDDVDVIALRRGSVPLWQTYLDLVALFRKVKPSIVHTRNLSGLDALLPAFCTGASVRIHGEHGRDADDLQGSNAKYRRLRRLFRPLISHYTAVSQDLVRYLVEQVNVPPGRITQIYNGVDTNRFRPREPADGASYAALHSGCFVVGTVGRLQAVKDQITLIRAFAEACRLASDAMQKAVLVVVGDGPLRLDMDAEIVRAGIGRRVHMLGQRDDIAELLRSFDLFVLPSQDEGISNTILEAMACGLPVLGTRVGGNPELIIEGETGELVAPRDVRAMAQWIARYAVDAGLRCRQGAAARCRAETAFSLPAMVQSYLGLYDRLRLGQPRSNSDNVKKSMILP